MGGDLQMILEDGNVRGQSFGESNAFVNVYKGMCAWSGEYPDTYAPLAIYYYLIGYISTTWLYTVLYDAARGAATAAATFAPSLIIAIAITLSLVVTTFIVVHLH